MYFLKNVFSAAMKHPKGGIFGRLAVEYMKRTNSYLEICAVKLVNLEADHRILEIGFGAGVGLREAFEVVKFGKGKVYGVDVSSYIVSRAEKLFDKEVTSGRIELHRSDVMHLPFLNSKLDRVIHCNCFYYWPRTMQTAVKEIYRVMKPGGQMVTTLNLQELKRRRSKGWLPKNVNFDPLRYMIALENCGFQDVHIEYLKYDNRNYQAIISTKRE